jgi:hypothetical protein
MQAAFAEHPPRFLPKLAGLLLALAAAPAFSAPPAGAPEAPAPAPPASPPAVAPQPPATAADPAAAPTQPPAPDPAPPSAAPATEQAPPPPIPPSISTPKRPGEDGTSFSPGERIQLEAGGVRFAGLYRETTARRPLGAAVVLHGRDSGPDDLALVDPLRRHLPNRGWASLSLEAPEPGAGGTADPAATLAQAEERVRAGVEFLKGKNAKNLVLIGHGRGARMVLGYLLGQADPAVKAAVVIDPEPIPAVEGAGISAEQTAQLRFPLLELRTGRDSAVASEEARGWRVAFRANPGYRQSILNDPHPDWKDMEEFLFNRIHGWLARLLRPKELPESPPPAAGSQPPARSPATASGL